MSFVQVVNSANRGYLNNVKMTLGFDDGTIIPIRRAPRVTSVDEIGHEWSMSERAGRRGVLRHIKEKTPTMAMQFFLGERDIRTSVQDQLNLLIMAAQKKSRVYVIYSPAESGAWQITQFSYDVNEREPGNHEPSRVLVDAVFTMVTAKQGSRIGPLTGGLVGDSPLTPAPLPTVFPPPPPTPAPAAPSIAAGTSYTVKSGDTLWAISIKFYGAGVHWTRIADSNGVTNPRTLQIGKVLRIP